MSTPKDTRPWLFVLVAATLALALGVGGVWDPLERCLYDKSIGLLSASNSAMDGHVRVIGIDEASLRSVGPWPWPRAVLAELIEYTAEAGAQVIVLDALLAEATPDDMRLQSAMAGPSSVILPYQGAATSVIYPHQSFLPYATLAHGDLSVDPDGRVRRIPALLGANVRGSEMIVSPSPGMISPLAISIEAVRQFIDTQHHGGADPLTLPVRVQSNSLGIGAVDYLLDGWGNLLFTFPPGGGATSVWPTSSLHSAVDVLNGEIGRGELENKLVFIGTTAVGLPDRHMSSQIHQGPIPGVFFHATAAWALLSDNIVGLISPALLGLLTLALVVFEVGCVYRQEIIPGLLLTFLALFVTALLYILMMFYRQLWFPIAHLAGTTVVFYVFGLAYRYTEERASRKRLADSLCRYFSPPVLEEILAREAGLVTREVEGTVLFADFSGFTSLAEKLSPLTTVSILNQHLAGLVEIVFDHGGTLDKFTGDGVMAFFGAPLPNAAHRELAVAAAWDMQELSEGLSKREKTGFELFELKLAVGIASGHFVVGNIGAGDRYDYTAIGDVVNTAARLEQLAGPGEILLDGNAAETLSCQWEIQDVGMQVLRGKQNPQQVYRLVGRRDATVTRQMGKGKNSATKLLVVMLLVVLVCATGGDIYAQWATLSGEQGPFFVIIALEDEVWVTRQGCDVPVEAFLGMQLISGDRLQTGFSGTVKLKGDQGETMILEDNTSLEIGANGDLPSRGRSVHLTAGKVWVKVAKLARAFGNLFRFSVITPTAFAGVRGTSFYVALDDDLTTEVSVFAGTVEVIATDTGVKVLAGHTTKVKPGREPEVPREHGEDENRAWEKRRQWFEQKPGKLPPPFQEDWQPPGLIDKGKQPGKPGKSQENAPFNNGSKGKGKSGSETEKAKGPPTEKLPPQANAPKGDGKDG